MDTRSRHLIPCPSRGIAIAVCLLLAAACDTGTTDISPRIGGVRIVDPPASIPLGESVRLNAVVLDRADRPLSDRRIYWSVQDTNIVHVDSVTGVARARAPGSTQVAASSEDKHDTATIVVPGGPPLTLGSIVNDELSVADHADEFTFPAEPGAGFNVFVRALSGSAAHRVRLRLLGPGGDVVDSVASRGDDASLRGQGRLWVRAVQGGTHRVRVDGATGADRVPYQLLVEEVHAGRETLPVRITLGTRVAGEALTAGDIDTFSIAGTAGQDVAIQFRALSGVAADALRLTLLAPNRTEAVYVHSNGDYRTMEGSGRITLGQTGPHTVRVQGLGADARGPYEFQVYGIARRPERVPETAPIGNTVAGEDISPAGDLDDFALPIAAAREVNVYLQAGSGTFPDPLVARVVGPTGTTLDSVRAGATDTTPYGRAISHLALVPGSYRLQVESGRNSTGAYRFLVRSINLAPERVSATVTLGAVVNTEEIAPAGDVDHYRFRGTLGDQIRMAFRARSGSAADVLRISLRGPDGATLGSIQARGDQTGQVVVVTLPVTGDYLVRVQGVNATDDTGLYRFYVAKVN